MADEYEYRTRISAAANGLLVVGLLVSLVDAPLALLALLDTRIFNLGRAEGVVLALGVLVGCAIVYGALRMKRLQSYRWAMAASILALVAFCSPCWIVSIPVGIWSLIVLSNPDIKEAFRQSLRSDDSATETSGTEG